MKKNVLCVAFVIVVTLACNMHLLDKTDELPPPLVSTIEAGDTTIVVIFKGQDCTDGEVVGMTYGYRQIDESQPMTYSILGETATHVIDMTSQETLGNFRGYTDIGESIVGYANQERVLHNATCHP